MGAPAHKSRSIYLRTLLYFRAFTGQTLLALILMSAGIGLNLLKPWPFKYIVDGLLPSDASHGSAGAHFFVAKWFGWTNAPGAVLALCGTLVVISLLAGLVNLLSNALLIRIGLKALLHLRTQLYTCLQALPLRFHDARRTSDSSFRVAYDSQAIQTIYNKGFLFEDALYSAALLKPPLERILREIRRIRVVVRADRRSISPAPHRRTRIGFLVFLAAALMPDTRRY